MFDVQAWGHGGGLVPRDALTSIGAYYRRVTIDASPMGRLVMLVMIVTVAAIVAEIVMHAVPAWLGWTSLALSLSAMGLAVVRTVPNAQKVGRGTHDDATASRLARLILGDHLYSIAAMASVVALQLAVGF
jgi:hypothetical protein